ncbi:MAG: methanogenesis marker 2 protein [Methanomicrobiales archaeon]|nr:methanogenesis marker 2 protein [Methanomicrobiales archaeon]MDI6875661.1 methanogenesis marker 2 protein [Methanomicrobiales archaeon]
MVDHCSIDSVAKAVREYVGVTRKHAIGQMIQSLRIDSPDVNVIASFGEDAAVIEHGSEALLLAADGIWSQLMEVDPVWAGYCSILVNIHDIAAMGGRPIAVVDVLSASDERIREMVTRGMLEASAQFGVPIVGGHLHPDTPYSVIDVAILGSARLDSIIYSSTARDGDRVIAAVDLGGRVHPSCALNWDSVTMKPPDQVRAQIGLLQRLGEEHLLTAGKDISNPGVLGTLGMLLEVSNKGAVIEIDAIPRPDLARHGITFEHWVRMYPGMGFVLTARDEHVEEVCRRFAGVGITARPIGRVDGSRNLTIRYRGRATSVFDLEKDGIMRLFTRAGAALP